MKRVWLLSCACLMVGSVLVSFAEVRVDVRRNSPDEASASFEFSGVPSPVINDAGASASFRVIDGGLDPNSGPLAVLSDGKVPAEQDEPRSNVFFAPGTKGGRLLIDLGRVVTVSNVNTYSWHPTTRAAQVYTLYGLKAGSTAGSRAPNRDVDPASHGWQLLAKVDTRRQGRVGGQYGVSVRDTSGPLGSFQHLMLDILPTDENDPFGNTFYSEIDVIDAQSSEPLKLAATPVAKKYEVFSTADGQYEFRLDVSGTPDLAEWAREKVIPMGLEWYPRLVAMLPSDNYEAPKVITVFFHPTMNGVADTSGTRVRCAAGWFRQNLKGEALGAVFHEFVHVVQQYGSSRNARRVPSWVTEGIADYIRWFIYEPQTKGAEITRRNLSRARYDASYRITANFLNWVTQQHNKDLVPRLNAAIRQGQYSEGLWQDLTGKPLEQLGQDWREAMEKQVAEREGAEGAGE